ncbi:hypothetical protein [Amnibacterium endophyticum]|uniref:Glycosyltransferase RgtA/B/C/D-like domain-containing protein n=1 Tax=Amnibacterium endophyticum TaxID=2109337 RepID=A0ABW4LAP7_9MICO
MSLDAPVRDPLPTFQGRIHELHTPRARSRHARWPRDPAARMLARVLLSAPFLVVAVLGELGGGVADTPNALLLTRSLALPWDRFDPAWVGSLYPPITTVIAAAAPGGSLGLSVVGALAAGVLLHMLLEQMHRRGFSATSMAVLVLALAANPLYGYAATQSLQVFLGLGLFGLGFADLVRFTDERDTQSGFIAGITLMLAALSDASGIVYVLAAALAAPLLSMRSGYRVGRTFANTLVVLFPTMCAFGGVMLLEWIFAGDPLRVVRGIASIDGARLAIFEQMFTTPLGWLWLASLGGAWAMALITGRPQAVPLLLLLYSAVIGAYLLGLVPYSAAGTLYLIMALAAIGLIPAAPTGRLTVTVNLIALLVLADAWVQGFTRPVVVEWMEAVVAALAR